MGEVKKIGDDYYIEFFARGLKYQQKAGPDKRRAEAMLQEIEQKIRRGEMGTIVRDADIDIFLQDFLSHAESAHTARTLKRYRSLCGHFQQFLQEKYAGVEKLSGITPRVVEDYKHYLIHEGKLNGRRLKAGVVNLSLILLRDVMEYARRLGYLNDNPAYHIRLVPFSDRRRAPAGDSPRARLARDFLHKRPSLVDLYQAMRLSDIGKAMVYLPYLQDRGEDPFLGTVHSL